MLAARNCDVHYDSNSPHVDALAVRLPHGHLRGHECQRAAVEVVDLSQPSVLLPQAEVDDLDRRQVVEVVYQNILGLQVSMRDSSRMQIGNSLEDTLHKLRRLVVAQRCIVFKPLLEERLQTGTR